jgi:hypothetical protein
LPAAKLQHGNDINMGKTRKSSTTIFQVCVKIKDVKEEKYTQQATGYAAETV